MLEKLREGSQGPIVKIILGLVILSFALAGIGSYIASPRESIAAKVNDQKITLSEFEQAYQNDRSRVESQYGEAFSMLASDPAYLEQIRASSLERLINEALVDQAAEKLGMLVSDGEVRDTISKMVEFQVDGEFNYDRYQTLLARSRLSPSQFNDNVRRNLTRNQLQLALLGTEFTLPNEAEQLAVLTSQERSLRYIRVPVSFFVEGIEVTDEELQSYFDENSQNFMTDEMVSFEYILVDADNLTEDVVISSEKAQAYYDEHQDSYKLPEERRVSHILITFGEDKEASRKKIEEVSALLADGGDFAELAKTHSEDTFSGENGGELDWFERGVMDANFDEAAFALNEVGELSPVVESAFGYHLIKLLEVKEEKVSDFASVEAEIAESLKEDQAMELYYELSQQLGELAFELPDSLMQVADEMGVDMEMATDVTRAKLPRGINQLKVVNAAFSDTSINERLNSDPIELSDTKTLVLRVTDYKPSQVKSFEEVREEISKLVTNDKASEASEAFAAQILEVVNDETALTELMAEKSLTIEEEQNVKRDSRKFDDKLLDALFALAKPQNDQLASELVTSSSGDHFILQLTAVNQPEVDEERVERFKQRLNVQFSEEGYQSLLAFLKSDAEISYAVNQ